MQRLREGGIFHVAIDGVNLGIHRREILQANAKSLARGDALPEFVIGRGGRREIGRRRGKRLALVRLAGILLQRRDSPKFGQCFFKLLRR